MSECQTCSQDEFIFHEETHLFEIFSDTVHRYKRWVNVDLKSFLKWIFSSFEIDFQLHNNKELSEESTLILLKSELSIMISQDSNDQNTDND